MLLHGYEASCGTVVDVAPTKESQLLGGLCLLLLEVSRVSLVWMLLWRCPQQLLLLPICLSCGETVRELRVFCLPYWNYTVPEVRRGARIQFFLGKRLRIPPARIWTGDRIVESFHPGNGIGAVCA